jgi:hypothetical protein
MRRWVAPKDGVSAGTQGQDRVCATDDKKTYSYFLTLGKGAFFTRLYTLDMWQKIDFVFFRKTAFPRALFGGFARWHCVVRWRRGFRGVTYTAPWSEERANHTAPWSEVRATTHSKAREERACVVT